MPTTVGSENPAYDSTLNTDSVAGFVVTVLFLLFIVYVILRVRKGLKNEEKNGRIYRSGKKRPGRRWFD